MVEKNEMDAVFLLGLDAKNLFKAERERHGKSNIFLAKVFICIQNQFQQNNLVTLTLIIPGKL